MKKNPALSPEVLEVDYSKMPIYELAAVAQKDWSQSKSGIYFGAVPYLRAMQTMHSVHESYGQDSGKSVVTYFLSNATRWRGPVAKAVKKELNKRIK
tara:strand:- start:1868 stop:2158 length:291 start_codon:yes stop_codon:yes gene_type:complete